MRLIIATSGSGGHLFCGLGIADAFKNRVSNIDVFFLGSADKLARKILEDSGFRFYKIYAKPFSAGVGLVRFIFSQFVNFLQSFLLFLYIKPKIVVSTGGFASIGVVFWSWIFNIACIIHEQNMVPGKANLLSRHLADRILISFEESKDYFRRAKCILAGMPIRFNDKIPPKEAREMLGLALDKFTILVMGGSKGAHRINQIVIDMLNKLTKDLQFIHLTGTKDLDFVKGAYKKSGFCAYVEDFSTRMDLIYSASNLVIGRAGSGVLSEITFFGLPSILIPYPYSRDRHQYKNADFMARKGAAIVMEEDSVSIDGLIELIKSTDRLQGMARNSADLANPGAVDRIIDEILELVYA